MAGASFKVPEISQAEMLDFHEAHFSKLATDHFQTHFLRPDDIATETTTTFDAHEESYLEEEYYEEDDDGLGYYEDGVKRTLTDEQIAIFRYSELEALRRAQENPTSKKVASQASRIDGPGQPVSTDAKGDPSDGEISDATPAVAPKKKKRKRSNKKQNERKPVIDLRKRTWDVVEQGLATLDYEGEENQQSTQSNAVQRRRISYDD
ncbi:hypothetical protein B0T17DRAFT_490604 [Bombardia bombarda]|uniref:Uncharacterized protein n=1 Tax=Bombardia bombarda TaxID=252184 RepID=A0AA40CA48_9PEZI|nr:hypothetical protein B0T17DRAFT_490604 [Bombardia bombarda]